jgi:multiple sugar transport system ATP-binding protein
MTLTVAGGLPRVNTEQMMYAPHFLRTKLRRHDLNPAMATVHLRDVQKSYGSVAAVRGVSLDIDDGQFVVLVGPSGCGKSTLLRMVAGLEEVTGGAIEIGGTDVTRLAPRDRDIAMVFQSYALYPHMTVEANMGFSLKMKGVPAAEIRQRVEAAARILDLGHLLQRQPRQLSGGQRQRVAMGRAIVRDPQVFLFDEPLSNLDAKLRVDMRTEIKALHQRLRTTSIYVTHDQVEAMTRADRIVVMRDGRVEQAGAPLELYDRPANVFVAAFIGSPAMNLLDGHLQHAQGTSRALLAGGVVLDLGGAVQADAARPLRVGLRPEHLDLAPAGDGIAAEVRVVEPTGAQTLVFFDTPAGALSAMLPGRTACRPGERLALRPRADCLHVFDSTTGARLTMA